MKKIKIMITDVKKKISSTECDIYQYWYFLNKEFKFQSFFCNERHYLLMIYTDLNSIAVLNVQDFDRCRKIYGISKSNPVDLLQNADLTEKNRNIIKLKKTYDHI